MISTINLAKGAPSGAPDLQFVLNGVPVGIINSRLKAKPERADPAALEANSSISFKGSMINGMGFSITPEEQQELYKVDPSIKNIIRPFIGGKEVNTSPTQCFSRYIIDFGGMSLKEAES